jgi:hypothetical protein
VQLLAVGPTLVGLYPQLKNLLSLAIIDLDSLLDNFEEDFYLAALVYLLLTPMLMAIYFYYRFAMERQVFPHDGSLSMIKSMIDTITPLFAWTALPCFYHITFELFSCADEYDGTFYLHIN